MKKIPKKLTFLTHEQLLERVLNTEKLRKQYDEAVLRLELAHEIRVHRLRLKLTQKEMAKKTKMPQPVIARIESGKQSVSFKTLSRVAHALGKRVTLV